MPMLITVGAKLGPTHDCARTHAARRSSMQLSYAGRSDQSRGPVAGEDRRRPTNARPGGTPSGQARTELF